tara:strand:+ start:586 stop:1122 length:537 start_codon:yes stop_codon:yes gene_type:complete
MPPRRSTAPQGTSTVFMEEDTLPGKDSAVLVSASASATTDVAPEAKPSFGRVKAKPNFSRVKAKPNFNFGRVKAKPRSIIYETTGTVFVEEATDRVVPMPASSGVCAGFEQHQQPSTTDAAPKQTHVFLSKTKRSRGGGRRLKDPQGVLRIKLRQFHAVGAPQCALQGSAFSQVGREV